jgi:hypothetical protein
MQYVSRHGENQNQMIDYSNSRVEKLIDEYIHSERDRKILKRRLIDGICYEPLAEEFDLSVSQVKRIVYRQGKRIFRFL